jgi:SAM-dependent methyltransferase
MNDDTVLPNSSGMFFNYLLAQFSDSKVAISAPITTISAGIQSVFNKSCPLNLTEVSWVIFFCVMLRRSALDEVGGIDDTLPGGDDFDLSFRLRKAGYKIVVYPGSFILHHGFQTGTRVHGDHTKNGGWNSLEMSEATNHALIRKHGFKFWMQNVYGQVIKESCGSEKDSEGDLIRAMINGEADIVELGCGFRKTIDRAIGVDIVPSGKEIDTIGSQKSIADVCADVSKRMPFDDESKDIVLARHVLEHCMDIIETLQEWKRILKPNGKLIISIPDEIIRQTIPLNPEHVHAFDPISITRILELVGFKNIKISDAKNLVSFIVSCEK